MINRTIPMARLVAQLDSKSRAEYIKNIARPNKGKNEDIFDDVDEKFAALTVLSTLNWINEWYSPTGKMNAEQISQKLSDFILGGLRKKMVTDINYKP